MAPPTDRAALLPQSTEPATTDSEVDERDFMGNLKKSTLGKLMPELRNRICEYAIFEPEPIDAASFVSKPGPGLLRTCHQLRNDHLSAYYARNTFSAKVLGNHTVCRLNAFVRKHAHLVTRLEFHIDVRYKGLRSADRHELVEPIRAFHQAARDAKRSSISTRWFIDCSREISEFLERMDGEGLSLYEESPCVESAAILLDLWGVPCTMVEH